MKTYLLSLVFALLSITVYSQQQKRTNYLTIWFEKKFNHPADHYYNYFTNPTAALEYLAKHGWQLVSVLPQMIPNLNYDTGTQRLIVLSRPVFYLKKEVE